MADLKFDIETMDLVIENGDLVLESNLSAQNGGILLNCKNFNMDFPTAGVRIASVINGKQADIYAALDSWVAQCQNDGAKSAKYSFDPNTKTYVTEAIYE